MLRRWWRHYLLCKMNRKCNNGQAEYYNIKPLIEKVRKISKMFRKSHQKMRFYKHVKQDKKGAETFIGLQRCLICARDLQILRFQSNKHSLI